MCLNTQKLIANLNDEQAQAVCADVHRPLLILAGAGSGKTRVLTHRACKLVLEGLSPSHILLLTFTNLAARHMVRQIQTLLSKETLSVFGGTFHQLALSLLRPHAETLGFTSSFTVLSKEDSKDCMANCLQSLPFANEKGFLKPANLLEIHSLVLNTLKPVDRILKERFFQNTGWTKEIAQALQVFMLYKQKHNLMDFDDLLIHLRALLLEHPKAFETISNTTQAVLVDEYQDTNPLQSHLVDLLSQSHGRLTAVGDDSQSIYGFRGASIAHMLDFTKRYPNAQSATLCTSYRSTPQIINVANKTLQRAVSGLFKTLHSVKPNGAKVTAIACKDDTEQAKLIATHIQKLQSAYPHATFAVLYRTHQQATEIQLALSKTGLLFVVRSGLRFFETAHVRDVFAYLQWLHNPSHALCLERILLLQDGIGKQTVLPILHALLSQNGDLDAALKHLALSDAAKRHLEPFIGLIAQLQDALKNHSHPGDLISIILKEGYGAYLQTHYKNHSERREHLLQIAHHAASFSNLGDFLNTIFLDDTFINQPHSKKTLITLSSIHQAKGLEWNHVLIPWLCEGKFPIELALREPNGLEEERRLFYVACTRAMDSLTLISPGAIHRMGGILNPVKRSRFVEELFLDKESSHFIETWIVHNAPMDHSTALASS